MLELELEKRRAFGKAEVFFRGDANGNDDVLA
jgi:hypothetical protein